MANGNGSSKGENWRGAGYRELPGDGQPGNRVPGPHGLFSPASRDREVSGHPAWVAFVRFCEELRHGEIECLKIQDGLPVLAEVTTKKVKFT
jgi:hypothetical protein